jgi:heavy metal translocating P-type ATPase
MGGHHHGDWRLRALGSVTAGGLVALGWAGELPPPWPLALYLAAILAGGGPFMLDALRGLARGRVGIELLMSVAALAAAATGAARDGAILAVLYSIAEAVEGATQERTRRAVHRLMDLEPPTARVLEAGVEREVPAASLRIGHRFVVRPGEAVPTDGRIVRGLSELDQAPVTGESQPVGRGPGDTVFAGTLNGDGVLEVEATRAFEDNTLHRIVHMVEQAQERRGRGERTLERFSRVYSPAVLAAGVLVAAVPPLLLGEPAGPWTGRAIVFLVAAAPCALAISVPVTMLAAIGRGARRGVLVKGGLHVEHLARVRVVALDKTGTLTVGRPQVTDVLPLGARRDVVALAAAVERHSPHPIGKAIVRHAEALGIEVPPSTAGRNLPGSGSAAHVGGEEVLVARPAWFRNEAGLDLAHLEPTLDRLRAEGKSVAVVGTRTQAWGILALRDTLRPHAREAVEAMRRAGIRRVVLLTGDNPRIGEAIGREAGLDEVVADLRPEDKARVVAELERRHGPVAMVGDGINDAPALAAATCGIAMGAAGSDVAIETADVTLMGDDLRQIAFAVRLARASRRIVAQNVVASIAVVMVLAGASLAGQLALPWAVLAHELSEFLVVGNGLRLLAMRS